MNRALAAGAAGMAAQQAVLDSIAANLANVDTPGFRASRPEFAALLGPDGRSVSAVATDPRRLFSQGRLDPTGNDRDLAIDGGGFFEVVAADGRSAFTRAGNFSLDGRGAFCLSNGFALRGVRLPEGTASFDVSADGRVSAHVAGVPRGVAAGRIQLCAFADVDALELGADGLFHQTQTSGPPTRGIPGKTGFGCIKQRELERANVSVVGAMMSVLAAQRAYEANAKTVQAADEMLRLANNLERQ